MIEFLLRTRGVAISADIIFCYLSKRHFMTTLHSLLNVLDVATKG